MRQGTDSPDRESGSARFHRIGGTEFWLTPSNKIFMKVGRRVIFPSLKGSDLLAFDDLAYAPSSKEEAFLLKVLQTQKQIRTDWPTAEEDEVAFSFS
jgi:hypothetical protein